MSDELDLRSTARPVTMVDPSSGIEAALKSAVAARTDFVVVSDEGGVKGLLTREDLESAGKRAATLEALLRESPALTVADALDDLVTQEGVKAMARSVSDTSARGVLVVEGRQILGAVSRADLVEHLVPGAPAFRDARRSVDLPSIRFRCGTCLAEKFPREADPPPTCPRDVFHGSMGRV